MVTSPQESGVVEYGAEKRDGEVFFIHLLKF